MNEPRVRPSVSGVEPSPVCAGEGEGGGRMREIVFVCVCRLGEGTVVGGGMATMDQMNGLYRGVVMRRAKSVV